MRVCRLKAVCANPRIMTRQLAESKPETHARGASHGMERAEARLGHARCPGPAAQDVAQDMLRVARGGSRLNYHVATLLAPGLEGLVPLLMSKSHSTSVLMQRTLTTGFSAKTDSRGWVARSLSSGMCS